MINFTLNDLSEFMKHEAQLNEEMRAMLDGGESPDEFAVQNVLNYSKAYSSRKSILMKEVSCVLN